MARLHPLCAVAMCEFLLTPAQQVEVVVRGGSHGSCTPPCKCAWGLAHQMDLDVSPCHCCALMVSICEGTPAEVGLHAN